MTDGLSAVSSSAITKSSDCLQFGRGELVYSEGEQARGAYIVISGKLKLMATSPAGRALILRVVNPGDLIGLSAAINCGRNDTNAVVVEPAELRFLTTASLYKLADSFNDIALWLAQQLSIEYFSLCRELSLVGVRRSAMSKLANLLVGFVQDAAGSSGKVRVKCRLTHEEMAQMIGTSRETVTRLLRDLRESDIACVNGSTLLVSNFNDLQALTH
jgi:CRP/FNR family transcriptional regulator